MISTVTALPTGEQSCPPLPGGLRSPASHSRHDYFAATMACLAHARHSVNVQRQGRSGRLRVQTTVVLRGWRFSSTSTRRLNTPVTPARLVKTLAKRSPGRGLIRGLRMIVLDGAGLALANGKQDAGTEPV